MRSVPDKSCRAARPAKRITRLGFTLVELLIVIAIIAILAGLLLPALARSKSRAQAIVCRNDTRQLIFAWGIYSADNNDHLVYNLGGNISSRSSTAPRGAPNWVDNIMDWNLTPDNTNTSFAATSLLAPYVNYTAAVYKCPADRALSDSQRNAGWTARVRSVSMNAMVGDPGTLLNNGQNINNPGYKQFLQQGEIPNPSYIFVFLDEHPDSINDGYFIDTPGQQDTSAQPYVSGSDADMYEWTDLPGSYHDGAGSFSFADGHVDLHRWLYDSTKRPAQAGGAPLPEWIDPSQTSDLYWVLRRMSIVTGN